MKLSIIIPVYNEVKHVQDVLEMVQNVKLPIPREIVVVDDGSTDGTTKVLKQLSTNRDFKIIFSKKNRGKGFAIRQGLKVVTGDFVLIQDSDLEYSVNEYPKIIQPLIEGKTDIVYGSRFMGKITGMRWQNRLANRILTVTANLLFHLKLTDEATAYKAFRRQVLSKINLRCERFEFCPEVTAKAAKKGYKFLEVPIIYRARNAQEGKKIKIRDGFEAFWTLIKYRFKD